MDKLELHRVQVIVSDHLDAIHASVCNSESKVTCVIRHPSFRDGYLIVTDDELPALRDVFDRATSKGKGGEVPGPGGDGGIDMRFL